MDGSTSRRRGWLAEAAIQGYFRDILLAIAQIARGPFETHIREHLFGPTASKPETSV
jgi:hypothetical protein